MDIGKLDSNSTHEPAADTLSTSRTNAPVVTLERNHVTGEECIMIVNTDEGILTQCYTSDRGMTSSVDVLGTMYM